MRSLGPLPFKWVLLHRQGPEQRKYSVRDSSVHIRRILARQDNDKPAVRNKECPDLQSSQKDGSYTLRFGQKAILLDTLEVKVEPHNTRQPIAGRILR